MADIYAMDYQQLLFLWKLYDQDTTRFIDMFNSLSPRRQEIIIGFLEISTINNEEEYLKNPVRQYIYGSLYADKLAVILNDIKSNNLNADNADIYKMDIHELSELEEKKTALLDKKIRQDANKLKEELAKKDVHF